MIDGKMGYTVSVCLFIQTDTISCTLVVNNQLPNYHKIPGKVMKNLSQVITQ